MRLQGPRILLFLAFLLDFLGQLLIFTVIVFSPAWFSISFNGFPRLDIQGPWLIFCFCFIPSLAGSLAAIPYLDGVI